MGTDSLQDHLAYLIASVNRQLEEELVEKLRPQGIPLEQSRILGILADGKGRPMTELAAQVLVEAPTLTKIIDRMVAQSLVYRAPDPADRRRVLIFPTRRGVTTWRRIRDISRAQQQRIMGRLKPADAQRLATLLRGLVPPDA
ncbi:MarR family winged helix-turn-helix transcriptional regulator [Desertibaculum subflavum]|uniref:MarR family winged helix-turn-helix transcriptional regulator n=1 Tax=Desertibaculum subflavum TaxID=2268458 RepID=UPI000E66FA3B